MAEPEPVSDGFLHSLQRLLAAATGTLRNRTELFAVELQEEKHALFEVLVLAGSVLILGTVVLVLLSAVIILLFAEPSRLYAAAGLAVLYSAGIAVLCLRMRKRLQRQPFDETIGQLNKDWECLKPPE